MKILVLCTYPIKQPEHGGQIRVRNIVDAYRNAGHSVEVVGVLGSENYPKEKGFVLFPARDDLKKACHSLFLMEDYAIGRLFSTDQKYFSKLKDKIEYMPDIIQIEQPWLFGFAEKFVVEKNIHPLFIYSSQNIEHQLKKQIQLSCFDDSHDAHNKPELVKNLELSVITKADATICVSENDYSWVKSNTKGHLFFAPNGVKPWTSTPEGIISAQRINANKKNALYCASAHPPNVSGFFEMFGGGFGAMTPEQVLVIAGGAGYSIANDVRVHHSAKLAEKVIIAGTVSKECLDGLLDMSHCIVLPLTQGGGTNLKTAEALWSGKYILGTTIALRGFEDFIGDPGVFVADDPAEFKRTLRMIMKLEALQLSEKDRCKRRKVLWEECLSELPGCVEALSYAKFHDD